MNLATPLRLLASVAVLALVASACGDDAEVPAATPPIDLAGKTFLSTDASTFDLVSGTTVRISFEDGQFGVNAGCNSIGGAYALSDGVLVADDLASTMMACADDLMDQDQRLSTLLTSRPSIALSGSTLTIGGDDELVLEEQQPAALEGTVWTITGVIESEAVSSVLGDATIVFADGEVRFASGCNTGFGPAEVSGATIEVGPVASTKMGCPDDLAALEMAITRVLDGTVTAEIDGATLTLTNGDRGLVLSADS